MFKQLKWYSFINKQKSDADMVNLFKKKIKGPDKFVILLEILNNKSK
jgi:hypothetical protein